MGAVFAAGTIIAAFACFVLADSGLTPILTGAVLDSGVEIRTQLIALTLLCVLGSVLCFLGLQRDDRMPDTRT